MRRRSSSFEELKPVPPVLQAACAFLRSLRQHFFCNHSHGEMCVIPRVGRHRPVIILRDRWSRTTRARPRRGWERALSKNVPFASRWHSFWHTRWPARLDLVSDKRQKSRCNLYGSFKGGIGNNYGTDVSLWFALRYENELRWFELIFCCSSQQTCSYIIQIKKISRSCRMNCARALRV